MEVTEEFLKERGFVLDNQDDVIISYVKKVTEYNDVVFTFSPLQEFFIWVKNEDFEDPNMDGVKVHIDTDDIDLAVNIAESISGVEF